MENRNQQDSPNLGLLAGIIAYTMWGVFPIYFKLTQNVPSLEILAHRVVWAVPFGAFIILARRQWKDVKIALAHKRTVALLTLAALVIAINWGLYIWAVQSEQIFQASLGYYINPLLYVLIGVMFLGERLHKLQIFAVILAAIGVLTLTIVGGQFPWIALVLAMSFTIYGVVRKQVAIGAMPGLFRETVILVLPALAYLIWLQSQGTLIFAHTDIKMSALLIFAGPLTVLPLLAFAYAARRLKLSTLGFLQFIGPTMQFFIGLLYGEKLSTAHLICFGFIWAAVALFVFDAFKRRRRGRPS